MSRGSTKTLDAPAQAIDLRVEALDDLFHPLDPSPLARRALAPEVDAYIFGHAADLPKKVPISIRIRMPEAGLARSSEVAAAVSAHFERTVATKSRELRDHFVKGTRLVVIAIACAVALLVVVRYLASLADSRFLSTMARWLTVVIWVVLWRPTEMLLHDWWPIRHDRVLADRLRRAEVTCTALDRD